MYLPEPNAKSCINYEDYLHLAGSVDFSNSLGVYVNGDYAYVANGERGMLVLRLEFE